MTNVSGHHTHSTSTKMNLEHRVREVAVTWKRFTRGSGRDYGKASTLFHQLLKDYEREYGLYDDNEYDDIPEWIKD